MLTFKPAAGSIVDYDGMLDSNSGAYLITSYMDDHPDVANIMNMTTMESTLVIVKLRDRELNPRLTVIG